MKSYIFFFIFSLSLFAYDLPPSVPIEIPMRDKETLEADLYLPYPGAQNLPCILIRSPAGRQNPYALMYLSLLKEGYAIVIQETRSIKDTEGKTLPFISDGWGEQQDGFDTIEWLAKAPFTNGQIGTVGASAMGITQLLLAPTNPKGLKAQYIAFACSDFYHQGLYHDGELMKHQIENWLALYAKHPDAYSTIYTQPHYNTFWEQFNMLPLASRCNKPALHVGGWYDTFLKGSLEAYSNMQESGGAGCKGAQKLVVGPWCHLWPHFKNFGEYDYPQEALNPPLDFTPERWFASYLKHDSSSIDSLPPVLYYVMGTVDGSPSSGNRWEKADQWPIPHHKLPLFLTQTGLSEHPSGTSSTLNYTYDPENPIPTLGGRNLFLLSGPVDQRPIENRSDLLLFTSEPLESDLEVTGSIEAVLYVDSDKEDTAFSVRLTDVYPDGKSLIIADGIARLSFHKRNEKGPHEVTVDLWPTSQVFAKGHRLRAIVSSSNYPRYEKHLNQTKRPHEDSNSLVAVNKIYTGKDHPSRIQLSIPTKKEAASP
jgi:predicted acyl esterase